MNKIKGSIIARIIACLMLFTSLSTLTISCFMAAYMTDEHIFNESYKVIRKNSFSAISGNYSFRVLSELISDANSDSDDIFKEINDYFKDKSFRYGIIKADSLDNINLNDEKSYIARNFSKNVKLEDLYTTSMDISNTTEFYYGTNFLELKNNYYSFSNSYTTSLYADLICYDVKKGIFYYHAEDGNYYPAGSVTINAFSENEYGITTDTSYRFVYDTDTHKYSIDTDNHSKTADTEITTDKDLLGFTETTTVTSDTYYAPITDKDSDAYNLLTGNKQLTFNMFDGTEFDYTKWGTLCFDDVRILDSSELTFIDSSMIPKSNFPNVAKSYIDENYTLHIMSEAKKPQNYWVVSYADEEVLASQKQNFIENIDTTDTYLTLIEILKSSNDEDMDFYVLQEILLDTTYELKDKIWGTILGLSVLSTVCLIFLMCCAGHRKGHDKIDTTFIDKIPFDILSAGYMIIALSLAALTSEILRFHRQLIVSLLPFMFIILFALTIIYILSCCVRIKLGKWWRNTIIYILGSKAWHIFKGFWNNKKLLWKATAIVAVYAFCRLFILSEIKDSGVLLFLYILEMFFIAFIVFTLILQFQKLYEGSRRISQGDLSYKIDTSKMFFDLKKHGENLNNIGEGISYAVDEKMKSELFKTELITNVSHDIKTPLTSIINYVDLLEKTDIKDKTQKEYLEILKRQSARLKKLIEDLIEASKASTGNLAVNTERLDAGVFLTQLTGEFEEKLAKSKLELIIVKPKTDVYINADGRHLWRVIDNLMNNICKYAQPQSRVYINLDIKQNSVTMTFKNISASPLNISSDELMERFVRGDSSRHTEGNGLGLSIAQSLMELMNGKLILYVDGDLFKVTLEFPLSTL